MTIRHFFAALMLSLLLGCATSVPAPVEERRGPAVTTVETKPALPPEKVADSNHYIVKPGDTLISISLQYGLDYRELAAWNSIANMNSIQVGQELRVTAPEGLAVATPLITAPVPVAVPLPAPSAVPMPAASPAPVIAPAPPAPAPAPLATTSGDGNIDWAWPLLTPGKILATFTEANKGIDIAGTKGMPVRAAAAGKVIYAQSGLRGYGKLVILKHSDLWLSAYAHNDKMLVTEGQEVKKGQTIGEMGASDTDQVKLHFEIRKQGKPVDPIKLLPNQ